jgi:hypothetical protein
LGKRSAAEQSQRTAHPVTRVSGVPAAAIVTVFSGKFSGCGIFYCSNKENIPEPENTPGKLGAVDLRGTRMSVVVGTIGTGHG